MWRREDGRFVSGDEEHWLGSYAINRFIEAIFPTISPKPFKLLSQVPHFVLPFSTDNSILLTQIQYVGKL